ncbi:hypothetical protein AX15_001933 [Amanita polypyramis BW_CC]|nr:hypothetical protein AX15_001933 [Amanita polypyramis BW_CC]
MNLAYNSPIPSRKKARLNKSPALPAPSSMGMPVNTLPRDTTSRGRRLGGTGRGIPPHYTSLNPAPSLDERGTVSEYVVATPETWPAPPITQGGYELQFRQNHYDFYYTHSSRDVHSLSTGSLPHTNQQATFQASRSLPTDTFSPGYNYFQPNSMQYQSNPAFNNWQLNPDTPSHPRDPTADQYTSVYYAGAAITHPTSVDPDSSFTQFQRGGPYSSIN